MFVSLDTLNQFFERSVELKKSGEALCRVEPFEKINRQRVQKKEVSDD